MYRDIGLKERTGWKWIWKGRQHTAGTPKPWLVAETAQKAVERLQNWVSFASGDSALRSMMLTTTPVRHSCWSQGIFSSTASSFLPQILWPGPQETGSLCDLEWSSSFSLSSPTSLPFPLPPSSSPFFSLPTCKMVVGTGDTGPESPTSFNIP